MTPKGEEPPAPTIGVLTALPKECAAVRVMLENECRAHCDGFYLGEVSSEAGIHRVAVGLLLDMGNNSAAIAAARMLREFPTVQDIIMCGIAGGVPKPGDVEHDVRLGDIVVSDRHGIVQYDLVKERPNGSKEHRHPPRPPSPRLLQAVRHLRTEEEMGRRPWEELLPLGANVADGLRPADNLDARGRAVKYPADPPRRAGLPRVFHGTVAASNTLLKNPRHRDYLGKTFGVKCVEMEGSGVADATWSEGAGYLVVRGICDFCDKHKGDYWHGAAAIAAAAYVRALIASMRPAPQNESRAVRPAPAAGAAPTTTATSTVGSITAAAGAMVQVTVNTTAAPVGEAGRTDRAATSDATAIHRSPVYNVPHRAVREFVGRNQDLKRLDAALKKGGPVSVSASLEGLPGVGKTELALQIVARLSAEDRFPGGIFWFDAEEPDLTSTWGGVIADRLGIDAGPVPERAKAAIQRMEKGGPALLVLDNVVSWAGVEKPAPLPTGGHVSLLVTTRQLVLGGRQAFEHLTIECLDADAAERLLKVIAGRDLGEERDVADLIEHLGGHTLAVELAGAFLAATPECRPAQYLARLRAGEKLGDTVSRQVRYARTVEHALGAIWERLDADARSAWLVLGEMAQADATLELLEACGVGEGERRVLRSFHLLTGDGGQRWRMHRLVRDYGARAGSAEERATARRHFVDGCAARATSIDLATGYRIYVNEGANLESALAVASTDPAIAPRMRSWLLDRFGSAAQSAGDFAHAKYLLEQALASTLETLGEDHPTVATRRSNLAGVLQALGDLPSAKLLLERALASNLETLGEDHPDVAACRSNLACVLQDLGDLPSAKLLLERALASDLKTLGEDHPAVAASRSNLALVLGDLGDLPSSKLLLEQALASDLKTLGENHPNVATCRSNLAGLLHALGDLPGAKQLLEQALASDLKNLGENHPAVATRRANLALVFKALGDLPRAKLLLERALASNLQNLGENHPAVATNCANLALVFKAFGDPLRAKLLLEQALASDLKTLGEDHPTVATRRANLAGVLQDLGDLSNAKLLLEQAFASNLQNLGEHHPTVATCRASLAGVLQDLGDLPRAKLLLDNDERAEGQ
jgi:nucleoside phosphorylase/tetratricopeptide (TPR) repeat protein